MDVRIVYELACHGPGIATIETPVEGVFFCDHPRVHVDSRWFPAGRHVVPLFLRPGVDSCRLAAGEHVGKVYRIEEEVIAVGQAGPGDTAEKVSKRRTGRRRAA